MPTTKDEFLNRIKSLGKSLDSGAVKNTNNLEHNKIARMLRNGLAVVSFVALEDYIKRRCSEIVKLIGNTNVPFDQLPEKLIAAATYEAVESLKYQLSIRDKSERIVYVQEHADKIASTAQSTFRLSEHIFGYNQANITAEVVKRTLLSFNIENPWKQMSELSSRLNLTGLPLEEMFRNAARRRHRAAHVAAADTPESELQQFVKEAYAISITFDALITRALKKIHRLDTQFLSGETKIVSNSIKFRFVKFIDGKWKDFKEGNSRATQTSTNFDTLLAAAKQRAFSAEELLIVYDECNKVSDWHYSIN